jgi:hypothetical protein
MEKMEKYQEVYSVSSFTYIRNDLGLLQMVDTGCDGTNGGKDAHVCALRSWDRENYAVDPDVHNIVGNLSLLILTTWV